jgi:hypothetical protein
VGAYNLFINLKKAGIFTTADLAGTWYTHLLKTGDGTNVNLWMYGASSITASGVSTDIFTGRSDGGPPMTQTKYYTVASDGTVTSTEPGSNFHGIMSSDKNLFVATVSDSGGYLIWIGVKGGATYTQADLTGNWKVHSLLSGDGGNAWLAANMVVDSTGATTFTSGVLSDGTPPVLTGTTLTVAANGTVGSFDGVNGVLSPDKGILILTTNAVMNNKNVAMLLIAVNR